MRIERIGVGLCALLWASLAGAQAEPKAPPAQAQSAEQQHDAKMAQALDPSAYGPAFTIGAQAELIVPSAGLSSILLGYDAVWMQVDLSLGMGINGALEQSIDAGDVYITSVRLAFPVHRGVRADFSLIVGGGATFIDAPEAEVDTLGQAGVGGRFRAFFTPNVAVMGTLGAIAAFGRGDTAWLLLARPLGSAAVVYFFR